VGQSILQLPTPEIRLWISLLFGNIIIFGKGMGKYESKAYDTHNNPHPMADPALGL
jgi:hypothetical protein